MLAEIFKIELQHSALSGVVWDVKEGVHLLIYVFYEVYRGKADFFQLPQALKVG